jgi:hypothetical protein
VNDAARPAVHQRAPGAPFTSLIAGVEVLALAGGFSLVS